MKLTKFLLPTILAVFLSLGTAFSADKININTATQEELQMIKGIGPSTAMKIVDYREQVGTFSSIDELTQVQGIGDKKLEKVAEQITVSE